MQRNMFAPYLRGISLLSTPRLTASFAAVALPGLPPQLLSGIATAPVPPWARITSPRAITPVFGALDEIDPEEVASQAVLTDLDESGFTSRLRELTGRFHVEAKTASYLGGACAVWMMLGGVAWLVWTNPWVADHLALWIVLLEIGANITQELYNRSSDE